MGQMNIKTNVLLEIAFKSGICLLIAPVPVHCFSITFAILEELYFMLF